MIKNTKTHYALAEDTADGGSSPLQRPSGAWLIAGSLVAAGLAAAALLNRRATRLSEEASPPTGKFIQVSGVNLHYVDQGEGEPIVLLHGNGVLLQDFVASRVVAELSKKHRVIAFDRPGFGYSARPKFTVWTPGAQAKVIAEAVRELGVQRAVVLGHSWGTMAALAMALDEPELVSGLVLLSGYYYGTARPDVLPLSVPAVPVLGSLLAHTILPLTGALTGPVGVKAAFAPAAVSDKIAQLPVALTLRPSQIQATAADTAMMVPSAISLSQRYGELSLPVIIMAGAGDLIVHVSEHAERLADELQGSELRVIPGQGHLFHYAVPERVAGAVSDVLRKTKCERAGATILPISEVPPETSPPELLALK